MVSPNLVEKGALGSWIVHSCLPGVQNRARLTASEGQYSLRLVAHIPLPWTSAFFFMCLGPALDTA